MITAGTDSIWKRGRLDARKGPGMLLFGRMYEDASIEVNAFRPGGRVLCIASAGCTAMSLAPRHEVVAIDINPVQLAYAERRFAGERGLRGTAEHILAFGRSFAPLAGWRQQLVHTFLDLEEPIEQTAYWRQYLDTRRFRAAFDGLLSLTALRVVYASPFLDFLPLRLGAVLRNRMERCFSRHSNRANPYARALLLGELPDLAPPTEANDIKLVHADAADFLEREPAGSFDGFALSNILDGTNEAYRRRLFAAVQRAAAPGAVVVLRSFREAPAMLPNNYAAEDRSMLWGVVEVCCASNLS